MKNYKSAKRLDGDFEYLSNINTHILSSAETEQALNVRWCMKILGIMWEENSTAALMIDGSVVAAVSQERFSRVKNDERYPKEAIDYVLGAGNISAHELDGVAFIGLAWGPA